MSGQINWQETFEKELEKFPDSPLGKEEIASIASAMVKIETAIQDLLEEHLHEDMTFLAKDQRESDAGKWGLIDAYETLIKASIFSFVFVVV